MDILRSVKVATLHLDPESPAACQTIPKPWGHEVIVTSPNLPYAAKLLHVSAGKRLSLQIHELKTETLVLISGEATLSLEDATGRLADIAMVSGVGYTVPPLRRHRLAATTNAVLMEASTPEVGFTLRLEDDYGRADETEWDRSRERGTVVRPNASGAAAQPVL